MVQWNILSNLPGECYGSYSLQLSVCSIRSFTIPARDIIDTGESVVLYLILCVDIALVGVLGVTPEAPPTTNLARVLLLRRVWSLVPVY